MISYYKTVDGATAEIEAFEKDCWINVVEPTEEELEELMETVDIPETFLQASLDDEETSRIDSEEDCQLIIIDIPLGEKDDHDSIMFYTIPVGFIVHRDYIATVCLKENMILKEFSTGMVKNVDVRMKSRFVLQILYKTASRYLQYLKQINKMTDKIELELHRSMKNKELFQLLDLEKSLVYFSTSLKSNEITMKKIERGKGIKLYEDDQELLEDVLIEVDQAIEMSNIYSNILSGTMDAFASIISNNLNIVMKFLTSITIVMSVPTIIASFYGMNVEGLPLTQFWWFPVLLSLAACLLVTIFLQIKKMF